MPAQYTAIHYTERLELEGLKPSIGSVGDAYDNALMESVIGLFKTECIRTTIFHVEPYRTSADVEYANAGWVDWYNNRRLHGSLAMMTPVEFEQAHYAASTESRNPHESGREPGAVHGMLLHTCRRRGGGSVALADRRRCFSSM